MQLIDEYDIFMSPLDDPVFGAIYANADVAGLAMESLVRAVLESDNEMFEGKIESFHKLPPRIEIVKEAANPFG